MNMKLKYFSVAAMMVVAGAPIAPVSLPNAREIASCGGGAAVRTTSPVRSSVFVSAQKRMVASYT